MRSVSFWRRHVSTEVTRPLENNPPATGTRPSLVFFFSFGDAAMTVIGWLRFPDWPLSGTGLVRGGINFGTIGHHHGGCLSFLAAKQHNASELRYKPYDGGRKKTSLYKIAF